MNTCARWAIAAAMAALIAIPTDAIAETGRTRAKRRGTRQKTRIRQGAQDGSLNRRETGRLAREQRRIRRTGREAASDGTVTTREKARLERMQNRASRHIARERHDAQGEMGPVPDNKTWDPGVNRRQRLQRYRVGHGIRTGSLTRAEVAGIAAQEGQIRRMERSMKADGTLTVDERKTLHQMLNETSQLIFGQKHDVSTRPGSKAAAVVSNLEKRINSGEITSAEARQVLTDLRRVNKLKRLLANDALPAEERTTLEADLETLVNNLYQ